MEETISLQNIFQILKKRLWIIIATTTGAILLSAIITFFVITPQYEASTQILVNQSQNENEELTSSDLQSSRELISTYNVIITSPVILQTVIQETDFQGSVEDLRSKISVEAEEDSQVVTVTMEDENPQKAVNLVNTLGQTFEGEISNIMNVDNVSILAQADLSDSNSPVSPQPLLNLTIALMIGVVLGLGLILLLEFLDKSIKNEQDIERELDIPILGIVPIMDEREFNSFSKRDNPKSNLRSNTKSGERKTS